MSTETDEKRIKEAEMCNTRENVVEVYQKKPIHADWIHLARHTFHTEDEVRDYITLLTSHLERKADDTLRSFKIVKPNQQTWRISPMYPHTRMRRRTVTEALRGVQPKRVTYVSRNRRKTYQGSRTESIAREVSTESRPRFGEMV